MVERPEPGVLRVKSPAKVNLSLDVLGRRADGYHEIRTVMQAVSLCDEIEFSLRPAGELSLSCAAKGVPEDERNLVLRAASLMRERLGVAGGVHVRLLKRIPPGGGLGGGSSNGAVALLALNRLWDAGASPAELAELASLLGSDVPFFLTGGTALCEGRGERVSRVACNAVCHYVIVTPPFAVSTAGVYAVLETGLTPRRGASMNVLRALEAGSYELLADALSNDLAGAACAAHAGLRDLRDRLAAAGGSQASAMLLSGSGSSFLVLLPSAAAADAEARRLSRELGIRCEPARSLPAWDGDVSSLIA
jgi:4-diphosphocytidyl-2-C-methyl-D-erythritol kinase